MERTVGRWTVLGRRTTTVGRTVVVRDDDLDLRLVGIARAPDIDPEDFRAVAEGWRDCGPHPNVVPCLYTLELEETLHVFRLSVAGAPLDERLQGRSDSLPFDQALVYGLQLASAIRHLHGGGLAHGDLRPEMCIITDQRVLQLVDPAVNGPGRPENVERAPYWAPEAWDSPERKATQAADVYAFGALLYELTTGHQPFAPSDATRAWLRERATADVGFFGGLLQSVRGTRIQGLSAEDSALVDLDTLTAADGRQLCRALHEGLTLPEADGLPPDVLTLCRDCCARHPGDRPDADQIRSRLFELFGRLCGGKDYPVDLDGQETPRHTLLLAATAHAEGRQPATQALLSTARERWPTDPLTWLAWARLLVAQEPWQQVEPPEQLAERPEIRSLVASQAGGRVDLAGPVRRISGADPTWLAGEFEGSPTPWTESGLGTPSPTTWTDAIGLDEIVILSNDEQIAATRDGETLWEQPSAKPVLAAAYDRVAVGSGDEVRILQATTGRMARSFQSEVRELALSRRHVALADGARIVVRPLFGADAAALDIRDTGGVVALDPQGRVLVLGESGEVVLHALSGVEQRAGVRGTVQALDFAMDGSRLAVGTSDGELALISDKGVVLQTLRWPAPITAVAWTNRLWIADATGAVVCWDPDARLHWTLPEADGNSDEPVERNVADLTQALHDRGVVGGMILGITGARADFTIQVPEAIDSVAFSADGRWLGVASASGVRLSQVDGKEVIRNDVELEVAGGLTHLQLGPQGQDVAGLRGEQLEIWSATGESVAVARVEAKATAWERSGEILVVGDAEGRISVFTQGRDTPRGVFRPDLYTGPIRSLALDPHASVIAVGLNNGVVQLLSLDGGQVLTKLHGMGPVHTVRFSSDGRRILAAEDQALRLWRRRDEKPLLVETRAPLVHASLSPDDRWILGVSGDPGLLHPIRVADGRPSPPIALDRPGISAIAIASDARTLVLGTREGVAQSWVISAGWAFIEDALRVANQIMDKPDVATTFWPGRQRSLDDWLDVWSDVYRCASVPDAGHARQVRAFRTRLLTLLVREIDTPGDVEIIRRADPELAAAADALR